MRRLDEMTEDEVSELLDGWTGEIRRAPELEPGTMLVLDEAAPVMPLVVLAALGRRDKPKPRKVLYLAPDVWLRFQVFRPAEGSA